MSTFNRYTFLATIGNQPVKQAGEPVILPGKSEDVYSVYTGEIVVWNPRQNITLSVEDIATAKHVSIAVGTGPEGSLATDLIHIAGEQFNMCDAKFHAQVTPPACGIPQVVDVFFDCTKCDDVYTLAFHLDDTRVRSQYGFNEKAEYVFSIPTECCGCDDCDFEHNCDEVACAFVDAINGGVQKDPSKITYFQKANLADQYQPFTAARLHVGENTSKRWELEVSKEGLVGITGVNIDGVETTFSYTTKVGDATTTLPTQLDRVVEGVNSALETVGGSAVIKGTLRPKNGYILEVNTCATSVELITSDGNLAPTTELNPFTELDQTKVCKGCGVTPDTINLGCGIRIFVDPVEVPCDCKYPSNLPAPNTYVRTIEPAFAGDGWVCHNHYSKVSQEQVLPSGFGYFWQDKAHYGQHNGGTGRNWRYSNRRVGRIGLPDDYSRASNAINLIKCDETYCVYNITTVKKDLEKFNNAVHYSNTDLTYMLIPEGDDATKASFEPYLSALQDRGICSPGEIECNPTVT